jgi:hypothetical protein
MNLLVNMNDNRDNRMTCHDRMEHGFSVTSHDRMEHGFSVTSHDRQG